MPFLMTYPIGPFSHCIMVIDIINCLLTDIAFSVILVVTRVDKILIVVVCAHAPDLCLLGFILPLLWLTREPSL